jgi:hypothetical protein
MDVLRLHPKLLKLDFNQRDITNSNWQERMILSILSVKQNKKEEEGNNNDKVTICGIQMPWNHEQKDIARPSTWPTNLIMNKDCKANKVMISAMADWIAKTKEYTSAKGKK